MTPKPEQHRKPEPHQKPEPHPKTADATERVSDELEEGVPEEEVDRADAERVADATASPQPEPDERH